MVGARLEGGANRPLCCPTCPSSPWVPFASPPLLAATVGLVAMEAPAATRSAQVLWPATAARAVSAKALLFATARHLGHLLACIQSLLSGSKCNILRLKLAPSSPPAPGNGGAGGSGVGGGQGGNGGAKACCPG